MGLGAGVQSRLALTARPTAARVRAHPSSCLCKPPHTPHHVHYHLSVRTSGSRATLVQPGFQFQWNWGHEGDWKPVPWVHLQTLCQGEGWGLGSSHPAAHSLCVAQTLSMWEGP